MIAVPGSSLDVADILGFSLCYLLILKYKDWETILFSNGNIDEDLHADADRNTINCRDHNILFPVC